MNVPGDIFAARFLAGLIFLGLLVYGIKKAGGWTE
jgi:hypothetical protein